MFRYPKKGELHLDMSLACSKMTNDITPTWIPLTYEEFLESNKEILDGRDVLEVVQYIAELDMDDFRSQIIVYIEDRIGKGRLEKLMLLI